MKSHLNLRALSRYSVIVYFEKMTTKLLFVIFSILVLKNQVAGMPIDEEDNGGEFECYVSKKKNREN